MTYSSKAIMKTYSQQMPWSSSDQYGKTNPKLTTAACSRALTDFFFDRMTLSIALESSSHPTGLSSLFGQPYVWAGGGLGNMDECPLQTCLAGGTSRDSLQFASVCLPEDCTALDLAADDFVEKLTLSSQSNAQNPMVEEYVTLHRRMAEINKFLNTGWTCGEYKVPFHVFPFGGLYILVSTVLIALTVSATMLQNKINRRKKNDETVIDLQAEHFFQEEKKESLVVEIPSSEPKPDPWYMAWNVQSNLQILTKRREDTACLDGLRVGSIFWVVLGHVMAIQSSSGGGYSNPKEFLPPSGLTTTLLGQLLFSARFAVDTFLLISGYLVVHVLCHKMPRSDFSQKFFTRYFKTIPFLLLARVFRILPLYGMFLGFWTQIAPHLGSGPFWYQWESFLIPCREFGWTNWLFVNNFFPTNLGNTQTCFYHSWYLALDLQLFLVAPLLVYWYQESPRWGKIATATLMALSIGSTMYLAWVRNWSINTFDGAAVARFDVEGYAKPHVRAQAYLAGMLLGMILKDREVSMLGLRKSWKTRLSMIAAIGIFLVVTFVTVTGAYARRACRYQEWPELNECGSMWSPFATFWYAGTSRALWSLSLGIMIYLCLQGAGGLLNQFLSLPCWTPLSHLSFGVYLIHPIIIFTWQFGNRQKEPFRLLTFTMNYISVCVVSFGLALLFSLAIEFPCANLSKRIFKKRKQVKAPDDHELLLHKDEFHSRGYGSVN